jgi:hypothetical protein
LPFLIFWGGHACDICHWSCEWHFNIMLESALFFRFVETESSQCSYSART